VDDPWGEEAEPNETLLPRIMLEMLSDEDCDCRQKLTWFVYTDRYSLSHEQSKCGIYLCLQRQGRLLTPWYRGVLLQVCSCKNNTERLIKRREIWGHMCTLTLLEEGITGARDW